MRIFKKYVNFLFPIILFLLWLFIIFFPLSSRIKERKERLAQTKTQIEEVERQIKTYGTLKKKKEEIDLRLNEIKEKVNSIDRIHETMKEVTLLAKRQNLSIEGFSSLFTSFDELKGKSFVYPAFEISIKGRFLNIGRFLEELQKRKTIAGIYKARLFLEEKDYPFVQGKVVIEIMAKRK